MAFYQLYITKKAERFSFKSGRAVQVAKRLKEDWLCYSNNFSLKQLCIAVKGVITSVLEYKASVTLKFKCVCVAMCFLVMSLFSRDFLMYTNSISTQSIITYSIDTIQYYGYETNHVIPYISIENRSSILISRI